MQGPSPESIRNVAVVSNVGTGKTTLVEALAFCTGTVSVPGSITAGTTVSDFEPEELHRHSSLSTSILHCPYHDHHLNILDTPGAPSLAGEMQSALRVADGVVLVINAATGLRSEIQRLWGMIQEAALPCLVFVNGLDKDGTVFEQIVETIAKDLDVLAVPLIVPNARGAQLSGVIELLQDRLMTAQAGRPHATAGPVPQDYQDALERARRSLVERVAEGDDQLLERYVTDGDLGREALLEGVRSQTHQCRLLPVVGGSALKQIGVSTLLDAMVTLLPSPIMRARFHPIHGFDLQPESAAISREPLPTEPFSALVFKTLIDPFVGRLSYIRLYSGTLQADSGFYNSTRQVKERGGHLFSILGKKYTVIPAAIAGDIVAVGKLKDSLTGDTLCDEHAPIRYPGISFAKPVVSFAITPKQQAEIEKVSLGLHRLIEEDPSLEFHRNGETKEMVLGGRGQLHIDVALEKLHRKYGAEVSLHAPRISYRETIRSVAQAQGKYKKQTGGHGQYGDCWLEVGPVPRGQGFEFENKIVGGAIPRNFIPAVEKGVVESLREGPLAGCPVVDVRVTVYDGSYHVVDSSELAFKIAASLGVKKALEAAHPVLLEPLMAVEVDVPADCIGAVIGDLNARRGRIVTVAANGHLETIKALVPQAEMLTYATALNSLTGGQGSYVMEHAHYEEVPREVAVRIVEDHKAAHHAGVGS
ncbi:MAG: elongation factor G [Nitrospirales bacterium]|nr:elongation factor G [Nitrospira sp. NTP2]MEB2337605.1 elongation factor G [Nitrospirales bacterium]QOJ33487.1 MAG: elongation factor G [Nitrospira sp.]RIK56762.1 MAG: elongation factor G [Nitrospira sp.]